MRTEKELFELMLTRQDLFIAGLCNWIKNMYFKRLITIEEYGLIRNYIKKNEPLCGYNYWWKKGEIKPRIEWIKQQIEKL